MNRKAVASLAGLVLPLAACSAVPAPGSQDGAAAQPPHLRAAASDWVPGFVGGMSLADKVGQLLVPSVNSQRAAVGLVRRYHVGGFVYPAAVTRSPGQTAALSNALQAASPVPLLIGLGDAKAAAFLTPLPSGSELAAAGSYGTLATRQVAGAEAHAVGITLRYGPVTGGRELRLATAGQVRSMGVVNAVRQGADQVIAPAGVLAARAQLLQAVRTHQIGKAALDRSVARILRLKQARGLFGDTLADPAGAARVIGSAANRSAVATVALRAITLVRNRHVLPLDRQRVYLTGADAGRLGRVLRAQGLRVTGNPAHADVTVLATLNAGAGTAAQVRALGAGRPVVVVALGKPGDLAHLAGAAAGLAAYSDTPASLNALGKVLTGMQPPTGRLPARLSSSLPAGFGLTL